MRMVEVGPISGNESIERMAVLLAPAYSRARWYWRNDVALGIPSAGDVAEFIAKMASSCRIEGNIECGGLGILFRGGEYLLTANRKLHQLL